MPLYTTCRLACSLWFITKEIYLSKNKRRKLKIQNQCYNCFFLHIKSFLQLVATLHGCSSAICDKIKQSAEGAIQAVIEFVTKRGHELVENDVSRFSYLKISVVLKIFWILELCVYLLLFLFFFYNKKIMNELCVYLLISRLLYCLVRLMIYYQQNNPIFALCYGSCNWEAFTFRNSWCRILLSFRFINLRDAIVSPYFLLNCLWLCWINYAVILFVFGGSFVS